jgi:two-component system sensor histidine kinase HydH
MSNKVFRHPLLRIPSYIFTGAIVILLPIVIFITYQNIQRQQSNTQFLLLEKGAALIRSFEAGTRAGMRGRQWGHRRLQQLLEETAQQPDIAHLIVTDDKGVILAHSQTEKIGMVYGADLDLDTMVRKPHLYWRILESEQTQRIFEVYRRFIPTGVPGNPNAERMMRGYMRNAPSFSQRMDDDEPKQVIFVGLDMQSLDETGRSTLLNSFITGFLLLLAGSAGIVLLFLFQNYRSTRNSLVRIKAFSDNLVDNMPIGLVALDAEKRITSVNTTAEEILDRKAHSITGKPASAVLPDEMLDVVNEVDRLGRILGQELECPVSGGKTIPMEISMSSIRDETGKLLGYALLIKDLSEIYHLKKEVAAWQPEWLMKSETP